MSNHPRNFATTGYNPGGHDVDLPEQPDMEPVAEKLAAHRLGTVSAASLKVDEYTAFEERAFKAFPDLAVTVGITSGRDLVKGRRPRRYVVRAEGQAIGAAKLEAIASNIEDAISSLITQVGRARREVKEANQQRQAA